MPDPEPIRILITGCRNWACHELADDVMSRLIARYGPNLVIVHGACPTGVDAAFDEAAKDHGIPVERHPARWDDLTSPGARLGIRRDGTRYNAYAGPQRNAEMVAAGAKFCLAVHRDLRGSKGTKGCARMAIEAGIAVWLIDNEEGMTRQITKDDLR